ncbi:MAG: RNA 2'-phosphotransferase [Pseudomonadota bacterium]
MDIHRKTEISKFLSYVLRHNPGEVGISLSADGWASIDELIVRLQHRYPEFDEQVLCEIVQQDAKQRYRISGRLIRAQQGHSIAVRVGSLSQPPKVLFHGTTLERWNAIQEDGAVMPMSRQHVHLSASIHTAIQVAGRRRGETHVVLAIRAAEMYESGHEFLLSGNGVWLTGPIPTGFIDVDLTTIDSSKVPAK